MTRASARGLAVWVAWLALGCTKEVDPSAVGLAAGPPPANARAFLDEARRELADPERMPLRRGMQIDHEGLRQALLRLRSQHGAQVAVAYEAEIEALPAGEPPAAERFVEVAVFVLPAEPAARDVEAINWLLDEDVRATVQRELGTYLTLMMHHDVGMTTADIGVWMAFLRAAKPELRRCGGAGGKGLVLCLDYGDDVFVLDVERYEPAWVVTRLQWMQAREG
jgi:hypothetical protein